MQQKILELGGARLPALGLGTWQMTGEDCERAVRHALDVGYRHFDTAQAYGNEDEIGRALSTSAVPREEVFLVTKLFRDRLAGDQVPQAVEESLMRLRTDWIDLVLIHWPNEEIPLEETLEALHRLKVGGQVRHVGVSNFPPALFDQAWRRTVLLCNQVEYHPYLSQEPLLGLCRQRGTILTAYCPLARGKVLEEERLKEIGQRHGKSPAQVALRWLLQQPNVAAVPKASRPEHIEQNFDVFDFELSDEEMSEVSALARGERLMDPDFAPAWGT